MAQYEILVRGKPVTVCNCCGCRVPKSEAELELCTICHEPICQKCFVDYHFACGVCTERSGR